MALPGESILEELVIWLIQASRGDYEDLHSFRNLSTQECKDLLAALKYTWQE